MLYEKTGRRLCDTERRIYDSDDALTVLYKDHGVGRQKELLAHVVRLRILTYRNDLNRKRIVSLQLTAHS